MSDIKRLHQLVEAMSQSCAMRDRSMTEVRLVRAGLIDRIFPDHFADDMPKAITANTIDVAARDISEMLAPLPSLACASGNMSTSKDAERAGKKNKIAAYGWKHSKLAKQHVEFCDSLVSYGFGVYLIEADSRAKCPRYRHFTSFGTYYFKDRFGDLVWLANVSHAEAGQVAAAYPETRLHAMVQAGTKTFSESVKIVTFYGRDETIVYLPDCDFEVLARAANLLSRVPAVVAERPSLEDHPRGQFDDSVWPQLARARMALYMLQAADKSINAPIAAPDDMTELSIGPDSILRSQNPSQIGRVRLDVPQDVFAVDSTLDNSVKEGSRYPGVRSGAANASIITGAGVDALMGTANTLIATLQTVVKEALEEATSIWLEMDVKLFGDMPKRIAGTVTGKPFEMTYIPTRDIGDSYDVTCTYGFAAGGTPAQAMVALLQLLGGGVVGVNTVRRQLPFDIDPDEEQREQDVADLEQAAKQGIAAYAQALGPMVMQGQSPTMALRAIARTIELRAKGKSVHEAMETAFTEAEQAAQEAAQAAAAPPGMDPAAAMTGGEIPPGVQNDGRLQGVAPGQQGMAPGGMSAVQGLMAELRGNGDPRMSATIMRKQAIGAG